MSYHAEQASVLRVRSTQRTADGAACKQAREERLSIAKMEEVVALDSYATVFVCSVGGVAIVHDLEYILLLSRPGAGV